MVLGYDGRESSRHAARWAARELAPDGTLVIVHACRPLHAPVDPLGRASEREEIGRAMIDELIMDGGQEINEISVVTEVLDEDPVSAVIGAAERHGAKAIVLGHERHSRVHRALGVLTSELLSRSPVPVVSVPDGASVGVH